MRVTTRSRKARSWVMNNSVTPALDQHVFQPFDGGDVEVVGRLVEQQHFRRDGQRLGQREAFLLAAGKAADAGVGVQPEARR